MVPTRYYSLQGQYWSDQRTVRIKWLWLTYRGNKVVPWKDWVFSDIILISISILVEEIVLYTGKSPLKAPLILWGALNDLYWTGIYAFKCLLWASSKSHMRAAKVQTSQKNHTVSPEYSRLMPKLLVHVCIWSNGLCPWSTCFYACVCYFWSGCVFASSNDCGRDISWWYSPLVVFVFPSFIPPLPTLAWGISWFARSTLM